MEYDNTKITTNDTFYYNAEINGQKCMNQVQNTQKVKLKAMEMYLLVTTKNISDVYLYFRA
jgi:hypothetical protein